MLKSRRRDGVLLVGGVVGLDFDAWGLYFGSCGGSLGQPFEMPGVCEYHI
jgi:hypothetical protein